jgi:hypothetical protein
MRVVAGGVEDVGVQHRLGAVDVFDEAFDAAGEGEIFFLAGALVDQADLDAVVEEGELAQALGEDVVVELDGAEDLLVGQEVHFGAALGGLADDARGLTSTPSTTSMTRFCGLPRSNSSWWRLPSRRR